MLKTVVIYNPIKLNFMLYFSNLSQATHLTCKCYYVLLSCGIMTLMSQHLFSN